MCYTTELESAKLTALRTLTDILATTDDPIEKRRAATAILRLPDPRATGCRGSARQPVPSTPDTRTFVASVPSPNPTSDIPHPTFSQIEPKPHASSLILPLPPPHDRLAALLNPLPDPLTPPILSPIQSLLAAAGHASAFAQAP